MKFLFVVFIAILSVNLVFAESENFEAEVQNIDELTLIESLEGNDIQPDQRCWRVCEVSQTQTGCGRHYGVCFDCHTVCE